MFGHTCFPPFFSSVKGLKTERRADMREEKISPCKVLSPCKVVLDHVVSVSRLHMRTLPQLWGWGQILPLVIYVTWKEWPKLPTEATSLGEL